jgi:hypothetical protein
VSGLSNLPDSSSHHPDSRSSCLHHIASNPLVSERTGAGAPPGEEHGQTDGLEDAGKGANGNGVKRALLSEDLGDELK